MGSRDNGEKEKVRPEVTNTRLAEELIKERADHKSNSCFAVKFDQVEPKQSLKRRLEESRRSRPEKPGGDQFGANKEP